MFSRLGLDPNEWRVVNPHLRDADLQQSFAFCAVDERVDESEAARRPRSRRLKDHFDGGPGDGRGVGPRADRPGRSTIFDGLSKSHAAMIAATEASRAVHAAELTADVESEVVAGLELLLSSRRLALLPERSRRSAGGSGSASRSR